MSYWAALGVGAALGALALSAARRLPLWPAVLGIITGDGVGLLPYSLTHARRVAHLGAGRPQCRAADGRGRDLGPGCPGGASRRVGRWRGNTHERP